MNDIVVPSPFRHKLNHFLFCQNFEKLVIICVKISITDDSTDGISLTRNQ